MNIQNSTSKVTLFSLLVSGILLFVSCNNQGNSSQSNDKTDEVTVASAEANDASTYESLLVGSWRDTSKAALNFTLFADGAARSDNMSTLLYKKWHIQGKQVIFTIESVGNGTSSVDEVIYEIQELNDSVFIIKHEGYVSKYTRVK